MGTPSVTHHIMGKGQAMDNMAMGAIGGCCMCFCFCLALSIPSWTTAKLGDKTRNQGLWGSNVDNKDYKTFKCDELGSSDREDICKNSRGLMVSTFLFSFIGFICNIVGVMMMPAGHLGAAAFHFLAGILGIATAAYWVNKNDVSADGVNYGASVYFCFLGGILSLVACGLSAAMGMGMVGGGDAGGAPAGGAPEEGAATAKV